ncbi:Histidinol-phosphate transaminase [Flagellimonas maritima]|uniref:Histidinol-phosphate transaminase n=1 Tax=Flagellimonas maritima TaxID=1383885 RepID=A0A2Z4LVV9_9FLAO|nr:histidinol-phosphate transaminase [Allomuricauda aurantiaca]AWX45830.1 Histidinol-phosphate transaminase [Allomuricauda aurantiaca]
MNRRNWISSSLILGSTAILAPTDVIGAEQYGTNKPTGVIKLNSNENPHGPSKKAREAIEKGIINGNRYPNEIRERLIYSISNKFDLSAESVILGAGSSDILQLLACWCVSEKHNITTSKLTFDILPNYIKRFGGKVLETEPTHEKGFDLNAIETISEKNPGVVYLVNPNNPTGSKVDYTELSSFCERVSKHSYIIVDEAYIEYLIRDESMVPLIKKNPKIIVVRTFSKIYGLAGLRVGYALTDARIAGVLRAYQIWTASNLNSLGIAAAIASLNDPTFVKTSRSRNTENLHYTLNELQKLKLYCVEPHANFIWFRGKPIEGDLNKIYAKYSIIVGVKEIDDATWIRVTIGKKEAMLRFIEVTKLIWN